MAQAKLLAGFGKAGERKSNSDAISISCYENEVPPFVEAEMARLYENTFSSLTLFKIYGRLDGTSTYVVRMRSEIITLFLFQAEKNRVKVLNEVIAVSQDDIDRFSAFIFDSFESVDAIIFHAIQTNTRRLAFPFQRFNCLEDIVLDLPESEQAYHAMLGKNTRRNIKRYTDKLIKAFPSTRFGFYQDLEASEQDIRRIIELNHARMATKNKTSMIDELETERVISLVKAGGLVGVVTIADRICAGAISFQAGSNYYLSILAHDPEYDPYWIGIICCYHIICRCIARAGTGFHFLWGRYDYKYTLRAKTKDLDHVVVYRSYARLLQNIRLVVETAAAGAMRQLNLRLHDAKHHDNFGTRLAIGLLKRLRSVKRLVSGR
ncbi:MAG: hypothetical protein JWQ23_2793 [Herminiimonas sp.]|nr:hypothetical protein [Herminiimonas sp.]